jgi:hypothetical protein
VEVNSTPQIQVGTLVSVEVLRGNVCPTPSWLGSTYTQMSEESWQSQRPANW